MPKPDLTPPTPETCIGYGCVIVPDLDEYQCFFINDTPELDAQINRTIGWAVVSGSHPIGALQATIVDRVLRKDWSRVAVPALALTKLTKQKFFVIKGSKEPEGTRTEMFELKARSVEDARTEIEAMPEVVELKKRLLSALRGRKQ